MKKIIFSLIVLSALSSCQHELDTFGDNPNQPTSVTPGLLLTQSEVATFSIHSSDLSRVPALFMQQIGGNDAQYLAFGSYTLSESDVDNVWNTIYQNFGAAAYDIVRQYGATNPYYDGMSKVLIAMNIAKATDLWNDVPFSQAFQGNIGIIQPAYDTQQAVYARMQQYLDEAIADFGQPASANLNLPAADDLIYGGDITAWTKAAYTLKARYALRLTNRNGASAAATEALSYLSAGGMTSNDDDMNAYFFANRTDNWNQWYAFDQARPLYMKMGKYFVDYLVSTNDPRLPLFATLDSNDPPGYSGIETNLPDNNASDVGTAINAADATLGMVTYAEAKFIEAEAKAILSDVTAQQALVDAVTASLEHYVGSADPAFVASVTGTVTVENIIQQKYVALFSNPEVYNDYRRTGFPALTPNPDASTAIPQRYPTSSQERLYNVNATVVSNTTSKVWWAQ